MTPKLGFTCAVVLTLTSGLAWTVAPSAQEVRGLPWTDQATDWSAQKQKLQQFGEQFRSADELYDELRRSAGGGHVPAWADMGKPQYNWAGIWTRERGGLSYDPDITAKDYPSAKLTPAGKARVDAKIKHLQDTGGEYDPISDCRPPGTPRWLTEPFLNELVVTPHQTWLLKEQVNDIRRIYTDGRPMLGADDSYASANGDSVGFWDGDILTFETKHLLAGQYQRGIQPDYSDHVEVVERWHKVNDKLVQADVWVFDPVNLAAPWYTRQGMRLVPNDDLSQRIRYWDCRENPNNQILVRSDNTSQYPAFTFVPDNGASSQDPEVKAAADARARRGKAPTQHQ